MQITRMIIVGMALLVFGACMNLGTSTSPATRFYLLESNVEPMMAKGLYDRISNFTLGVGPVTIPPYLDRPQLVTRITGNELHVDEFHQWAEPLKATILRVIQENLSVLSGARHVHSYPLRRATVIDYQISLDVLRFDADTQGHVTLKSVWRIVGPDSDQELKQKHSTIIQPSTSTANADVVNAMSTALAVLAEEMAQALVDGLAQ